MLSKITALTATLLATPIQASAQHDNNITSINPLQNPYPFYFPPIENAGTPDLFPMPQCHGFDLEEATIDQLQEAMENGILTSAKLLRCCLRRARQVDKYINSIMELNPDAEEIAELLDKERAEGRVRGPLHGIPFLVKDNIATKDKMETTAGSWMLLGSVVPRDAFVVAKLRSAGALLMGKTTLSEWADMRSNNYSEGYSARGGQARSPYNLTLNPGGSSSGSAAAVAASIVPFTLGTETDGSIINPAERNALVGIKPTVGLTSRSGVIPESIHQDTVGPFARTVRDAVYAFNTIYGVDPLDNYTSAQIPHTPSTGYLPFLTNRTALKNATFGLPWSTFWTHVPPSQLTTLLTILSHLESAGATIVNNTELPSAALVVSPTGWDWDFGVTSRGRANESEYTVVKTDFYNNIQSYLSELNNTNIKSLEDIVAYNYANSGTEGGYPYSSGNGHPAFYSGQDGFLASLATKGIMDQTYYEALSFTQRKTREEGIDAALAGAGAGVGGGTTSSARPLDALLVPPDAPQTYQVAAQAGYPMITLPAGVSAKTGMPFGIALMGGAWSEGELVRWGSAVEDCIRDISKEEEKGFGRTRPKWFGYLERNLPVRNL